MTTIPTMAIPTMAIPTMAIPTSGDANPDKACARCGAVITSCVTRRIYCSYTCRWKAGDARRNQGLLGATIACLYCKRDFVKTSGSKKFCTPSCQQRAKDEREAEARGAKVLEPRTCRTCGTSFTTRRGGVVTCSVACSKENKRKTRNELHARARHGVACVICGEAFVANGHHRVTCSSECAAENTRLSDGRAARTVAPSRKATKITTPCASCEHGIASKHADLGWECGIWRALACKPLIGAVLFAARLETGT